MTSPDVEEKLDKFGHAISIETLVLIAFPFILSFVQQYKDNTIIVSLTVAVVLLFSLAPIPALVDGLIAFIADSKIPIFWQLCNKLLSPKKNRLVEFFTFYFVGLFILIPVGIMFQVGLEKLKLFENTTTFIPYIFAFVLLVITCWMVLREKVQTETV